MSEFTTIRSESPGGVCRTKGESCEDSNVGQVSSPPPSPALTRVCHFRATEKLVGREQWRRGRLRIGWSPSGANMLDDPHALKLYIDGNCYKNPGGAGAIACVAQLPECWNREEEVIFEEGFHKTTNNRMELQACIRAHEYVAGRGNSLGVERVLIVTDSLYVFDNFSRAAGWRTNKWTNAAGRPLENSDLWKRFLPVRQNVRTRTEIIWTKGKKSAALKMVDRAAKEAGKCPQQFDRGFRGGKVARSKGPGKSAALYIPRGRNESIRIYRTGMIRKTAHKIIFDLYDDSAGCYSSKCYAYTEAALAAELHRQHCYCVSFNGDPGHPAILAILEELVCASLENRPTTVIPNLTPAA